MIRLLVIEDNSSIIVPGLRNLFRPERDGIKISCFASDPVEAIRKGNPEETDVILLDLWLPGHHPVENLEELGQGFPGKPVIIYTQDNSPVWRRKMLSLGAKAYLTKSATREELKMAIEKVATGEVWITGILTDSDKKAIVNPPPPRILTPVQHKMVDLLSGGVNREEIARILDLHPSAVDKTFAGLRLKFNCRNNYELLRLLLEQGAI